MNRYLRFMLIAGLVVVTHASFTGGFDTNAPKTAEMIFGTIDVLIPVSYFLWRLWRNEPNGDGYDYDNAPPGNWNDKPARDFTWE
jgi:hypothetical protein